MKKVLKNIGASALGSLLGAFIFCGGAAVLQYLFTSIISWRESMQQVGLYFTILFFSSLFYGDTRYNLTNNWSKGAKRAKQIIGSIFGINILTIMSLILYVEILDFINLRPKDWSLITGLVVWWLLLNLIIWKKNNSYNICLDKSESEKVIDGLIILAGSG